MQDVQKVNKGKIKGNEGGKVVGFNMNNSYYPDNQLKQSKHAFIDKTFTWLE